MVMANRRPTAQASRLSAIAQSVIDSIALVKTGVLLGILGIAFAVVGEAISGEGSALFAIMHIVLKYFGVSLFITCGVLLLVEKLPETIEMRHLEEEMERHAGAIEKKNDEGRSQINHEGSALAYESLQKLFEPDVAKAVKELLKVYLSIPIPNEAQRRITAWLLKNEILIHVGNIARFASEGESPCFDVRYLGSGPYFTAAMLTAHMKSLEKGDEYFSAGEIWFWLDAEATKDFVAEIKNACERGVRVRRVFDLNSPSPFNFRASSEEELERKSESVLKQHRRISSDTRGMYSFLVLRRGKHGPESVKRYSVFSKHAEDHQLVFRPQNRELGTFTLEYVNNAADVVGTELLWNYAWNSQSKGVRLFESLKRGYASCRRRLVGVRRRAFSIVAIVLGLLFVYWSQHPATPAVSNHEVNIENHESGPDALHAILNAVVRIVPDLKYDIGIALEISGIAAILIAPRRRRLHHATERASHEFFQFEERREAAASARNCKSLEPTSREGFFDLFEKATAMCVDDAECSGTFVNLVRELDRLSKGRSPEREALWATAKWVLTEHLRKVFDSVNTFGDEGIDRRGSYTFNPPSEVAVMEQLYGELIAHAHSGASLDSLIDFEYFIPTDSERFEMKKLREALKVGFKVRRIFHCTYHNYAQPSKGQVTESDINEIYQTHKELQHQYPNYHVKFLTADVIRKLEPKAFDTYGIENLNQYLHAALKLHSAGRVYYLNIKYASDEKQLSLERTNPRDKRITFFDKVWEVSKDELPHVSTARE